MNDVLDTKPSIFLMLLCLWFFVEIVSGIYGIYLTRGYVHEFELVNGPLDSSMIGDFWSKIITTLIGVALYLIAILALLQVKTPTSVWIALAATFWAFPAWNIVRVLTGEPWSGLPLQFQLLTVLPALLAYYYLLFSREVAQTFHFGSRQFFTRGMVNLWRKGRNRPSIEESEAERLHNTFN